MTLKIKKWGNSLALRLPVDVLASLSLVEDSQVSISVLDKQLLIKPLSLRSSRLTKLVADIKSDKIPPLVDWGKTKGREIW